ncbi:MAG: hypothetical protein AB1847_09050 [bacterium]
MSMKKGFTFIATLLILACVALAGSSAWAAPTMNPEDIRAYDKSDPTQAPYDKLSATNRTIYYEGKGYTGVLGAGDINVTCLVNTGTVDEPEYDAVKYISIPPVTTTNKCTCSSSGDLRGSFVILASDLTVNGVPVDRIDVSIRGLSGLKSFDVDYVQPDVAASFLPVPGSEIRNFFTASVTATDEDEDVFLWAKGRVDGTTADRVNMAQSSQFDNPATLILDSASFMKVGNIANPFDILIECKDKSGNTLVNPFAAITGINYRQHAGISNNLDAYVKVTYASPTATVSLYIPASAQIPATPSTLVYYKDGEVTDISGRTSTPEESWNVFTIDTMDVSNPDFSTWITSWTTLEKMTVGANNGARMVYMGVSDIRDEVGPVLLESLVDDSGSKTFLLFSDPLDKLASLDPNSLIIAGEKNTSIAASYSTDNDRMIVLGRALKVNTSVQVGEFTKIKDKEGNKAPVCEVLSKLGSKVARVEVRNIVAGQTNIQVHFNDVMGPEVEDESYYWVEMVPGLEDVLVDEDDASQGVVVDSAVQSADGKYVTLTIDAAISDTSASGLPKVKITEDGMANIKGTSPTRGLLISNNAGVATLDRIGPYITSASYDKHPSSTQPMADESENHVLTLTFSEAVQVNSTMLLVSLDSIFALPGTLEFGYSSKILQSVGSTSTIEIQMGEDEIPNGTAVMINDLDMIKDINGYSAEYNPGVTVFDATVPWITEASTMDEDADGHIDALLLTWNEPIVPAFYSPALVASKTTVDGYSLSTDTSSPISITNDEMTIYLEEKDAFDTGAKPGFTLYLDADNYVRCDVAFPDPEDDTLTTYHKVSSPIGVLASGITDAANPYPVAVTYQIKSNGTDRDTYTIRVQYSEEIDPNVWNPDVDIADVPDKISAAKDFTAYRTVTVVTDEQYRLDRVYADTEVDILDYNLNGCYGKVVQFTADIIGADAATRTGIINNLYFGPATDTVPADGIVYTEDGIFDKAGNFAQVFTAGGSGTGDIVPQKAVVKTPESATDPIADHEPEPSAYSMTITGTITDADGEAVPAGWRVYAYSLNNLYRYAHVYQYNSGRQETKYLDKVARDPNVVSINAVLAPGKSKNGVCYGSCAIIGEDGSYAMHAYGEFTTPGFKEGDSIFLVVESNDATPKQYLVTNNCKDDQGYYLAWKNDDVQVHDIDLGSYESKSLYKGWNFVSFSTLKRYVVNDGSTTPNPGTALVDDATGIPVGQSVCPVVNVPSIDNVLSSLSGQWERIYFYDGSKPAGDAIRQTKAGSTKDVKKVEYFSIGNGYWIYIPEVENAKLVVLGNIVEDNTPKYRLPVKGTGWNMVGYWGGNIYYRDMPEEMANLFSSATGSAVLVDSIDYAFDSFKSSVDRIKTSYKGTKCWYNPPVTDINYTILRGLTDLKCVGPGFGYMMRVKGDCNISWP